MSFIETIPAADATGDVLALYRRQSKPFGYLPNYAKVYCYRPELMAAWAAMQNCINQNMDSRTYALVSFAAAVAINTSYCVLAFGKKLHKQCFSVKQLAAITQERLDELDDKDAAIVSFAMKVARDSSTVSEEDIIGLRNNGLSEEDIFDIAAAAAARCFFAKSTDALGVYPDAALQQVKDELGLNLIHGRELDDSAPEILN